MTTHAFDGFDDSFKVPVACCSCGARRERATEKKARDAIDLHITRESLAEGRRRATQGEGQG